MSVLIKEVNGRSDLRKFINFPLKLYAGCDKFVPSFMFDEKATFIPEKNPAYEYCESKQWLAYKDGKLAGRIAGIINHKYIDRWGKKAARFGWIDFIDDEEVSSALINKVIEWARGYSLEYVHGPLGFTDMDYEGMLIEGFEEMGTLPTIYNYPYYPEHLTKLGFEKEVDWVEFEIKVPEKIPEKAERIAEIVKQKLGIRVFDAKKSKDFIPYGKDLFGMLNNAYKDLFGFVELTDKQIDKYIKQYIGFVVPDYLKILLDKDDRVAGFVIAMPSLTKALQKSKGRLFPTGFIHILKALKKSNRYLDMYLGAIRPDLQGKGADALLMTELTRSAIKNGIITAETSIELETNVLVQSHWKYFENRQHKRRRCFIKKIV